MNMLSKLALTAAVAIVGHLQHLLVAGSALAQCVSLRMIFLRRRRYLPKP